MHDIEIRLMLRMPKGLDEKGYLGASTSYAPRPGEDWRRGNDLSDGPADLTTFTRIMADIAAVMAGHRNAYERDRCGDRLHRPGHHGDPATLGGWGA